MSPAIAQSTCTGTLLQRGDQGNAVKSLQSALAARKYSISVDGDFGGETERILKLFQASSQLVPDGIYGEQTCKALTSSSRPSKPITPPSQGGAPTPSPKPLAPAVRPITNSNLLRLGDQGEPVRYLQEKLRIVGYAIPATGVFNDLTNRAVKDFQRKTGLSPDGVVGSSTNDALEQSILLGEKYGFTPTPRNPPSPNIATENSGVGEVEEER